MSGPSLHVDIEKRLGDFSLTVKIDVGPQVLVLFGPSGAGKTTVLNAIAGLLRPEAGEIALDGQTFFRRDRPGSLVDLPPRERQVGYVFQQYLLFPHLTVGGNVAYGLPDPKGPAARARVAELLQRFHLEGMEDRRTWQLSGGQQQRVALARALAREPRVLLLDEPFGALDLELRRSLRREVRRVLKDSQLPVLFVTHDTEEALALADTVLVMDRGRVVASGDPLDVLGQPAQERVARLVGVENLLRLTVAALHPVDGVMVCAAGPVRLEVPLTDATPGEEVVIGIRAADIILANQEPRGLSARNLIRGTVTSVEPRLPGYDVALDCGFPTLDGREQRIVCHVTRGALEELAIRPGATLWAVIKAAACYVLQDGTGS